MASHAEVAKRWADGGRAIKGHNVFMGPDGKTIYSYGYHYPIARRTRDKDGNECVLFNAVPSSVSTEKQKGIVRWAIPSGVPVYYVATPEAWTVGDHLGNAKYMMRDIMDLVKAYPRCRVRLVERYQRILDELDRVRAYVKAFGVDYKVLSVRQLPGGRAVYERGEKFLELRRQEDTQSKPV